MSPMLMPKRVKHRKVHRGRMKGASKGGTRLVFGEFGLQALEAGWLTSREIEAARVFPHKPVTKKPAETRMGGGKGAPESWVAVVKPGKIMFELSGVAHDIAKEAIKRASNKLSIKTKFIYGE